jgi:OmpA-OmpF porin, OOP family
MFKKISLVMLVISLTFLFACATSYVKDIDKLATDAATVEVKSEAVATPAAKAVVITKTAVIKAKVLFDFDSFELDIPAKVTLEKIAEEMSDNPDTLLILRGHTDKVGSNEYNQILSEDRADAVEDYLHEAGITEDQIFGVQAFGESMLLPDLSDHENRRVIILSVE